MTEGGTPALSRRELGKAERRRRIAEAAAELVREAGFDAVSMVQIAERAGLSPATLYNLFQTKGAIFREVFDQDLRDFERQLARAPATDAVDRIFVAIDLAATQYRRDPKFYRAMARVSGRGAQGLATAISEPRTTFWQSLLAEAATRGLLRADTDIPLLGVTLSRFMRGIFLEWAAGSISADRMAGDSTYGFALMLLGHSTSESAGSLKNRLAARRASTEADAATLQASTI